ncbi:hypothetical protein FQN54_001085 [Arachnomyces sp. PD_36]|nr:hypothetical protein FQN54_001085 [Arachnomyces sp. PD_36]
MASNGNGVHHHQNGNGNDNENGHSAQPTPSPQRLLLVSCPRTASNLLAKILSLPDQPNIFTNELGGYFFYDGYQSVLKDNRVYKPIAEWSAEDKDEVQKTFQKCLDNLEDYSERAKGEGKTIFAKEHAFWFSKPTALLDLMKGNNTASAASGQNGASSSTNGNDNGNGHTPSITLTFPPTYPPTRTFSALNQTLLPDEYLRTWKLTFIIRHPALCFPSLYRAMNKLRNLGVLKAENFHEALATNMSMQWTRLLFDWCMQQVDAAGSEEEKQAKEPVLLDANDVIHNPAAVARFCEKVGTALDPKKLKFEWDSGNGGGQGQRSTASNGNGGSSGNPITTGSGEEAKAHEAAKNIMLSTLIGSSGVVKDKAPEVVDIAAEVEKWKKEFGEEDAAIVEKAVLVAMPDYEYLKARRCA